MEKNKIETAIKHLQGLLQLEKNEDLKQYRAVMLNTSFDERKKKGVCWYPVQFHKSNFSSTEQLVVCVTRNESERGAHQFHSGKPVSLFSNVVRKGEENETVNGVVNQVRDNEMWITLHASYEPDWLGDGKLGVQLLFDEISYREMERGLQQLLQSDTGRIAELKQILIGDSAPRFITEHNIVLPELNIRQNEAMNKALNAKDIAIIHGPPGTGKTTTLIQTILQTLKVETQVLVCAPSNAAVDLLAEKLCVENVDVVRIGNPARVNNDILNKTLDARITQHLRYKELRTLRSNAEEYRSLANKYKRNFGAEEREQRKLLRDEAKRFQYEANSLSDIVKDDVLSKTRVIVTTLVGANHQTLKNKRFSTVFIDEAAQGLEPATWLPILKSDRVIFAGDHHQLPPTIKSFEATQGGLENTLFEKVITRFKADVMLNEQYRMHRDIMEFSSRYFYNNALFANVEVARNTFYPEDLPIEFIDTAGCGFEEVTAVENKSISNPEESELVFKHLFRYLENAETLHVLDDIQHVGIISPYKAQVMLLQDTFKQYTNHKAAHKVDIQTIDSFQGQERDIVYISLVRSNDKRIIGFLKDIRRMNVAMTRARKKLIIIGDSATICSHPFYNALFDYVNEIGVYRSAFELMYE